MDVNIENSSSKTALADSKPDVNTVVMCSQVFGLDVSTEDIYRLGHGSFHRKHKKPRSLAATDWLRVFRQIVCHEPVDDVTESMQPQAQNLINEFFQLNGDGTKEKGKPLKVLTNATLKWHKGFTTNVITEKVSMSV